MPKRGSDVQITKDDPNGSDRSGGADEDTDPVALLYWQLKDRPSSEQLDGFEDWLKREHKGAEEGQKLREKFNQLQKEGLEKSTMSRRATDAQMARRRIATPKGRPGGLKGAPLAPPAFNSGAPQQSQPATFGGFGQSAQQNGGFNFQFGGAQAAPSFGGTPATPASSASSQSGGFNYSFGGFGQQQPQSSTDSQQQQQQQPQPNGIFSGGFGAGTNAQTQSSNPFGSGSSTFTFGQTSTSQAQNPPPSLFASTTQSFGGQPSTSSDTLSGAFGASSAAQTPQPQQPALLGGFGNGSQQKSAGEQQQSQPAPLFSNFATSSSAPNGFSFGNTTSKPTTTPTSSSTSGAGWGVGAPTTTQPSSIFNPTSAFANPASTPAATPKPSSVFGALQAPTQTDSATSQPEITTTTAPSSKPPPFSDFLKQPQPDSQNQQPPQSQSTFQQQLPPASGAPDMSSHKQATDASAPSLELRRQWYNNFDAKLNVTRQSNPLADQPNVLAAFSHLWKVDKTADQAAQQLSTSAPITVANTSPQSPAKSKPSTARQAPLPSSLSKYQRPFEELTLEDWKKLSKTERLATLQGAFKAKIASSEPDQTMLELTNSFIATWNQVNSGEDAGIREALGGTTQQKHTASASSSSAQQATVSTPVPSKPAGGLFAAGGFGGFSTPQPAFNKPAAVEAPKTVAAPTATHPSDKFFSSLGASKRKASNEDINADSAKKSREQGASNIFNIAGASASKANAGSTQTSGFTFGSTPSSSSQKPAAAAPSSNTASMFQNILDKKQETPTPASSNPFASISTKPSIDTAPSGSSMTSASTDSPFKISQASGPSTATGFTPFGSGKSSLFGASLNKSTDADNVQNSTTPAGRAQSPSKETAAAGVTAGATPSTGNAPPSGGLFGFGNMPTPTMPSTPSAGGLLNFNKQPAVNGLASAPPKFSAAGNKATENGSVETPRQNPFANLLGAKSATVQKPTAAPSDGSGSVLNSPNLKPLSGSSNIFGHLSDAESNSAGKKSNGDSVIDVSDDDDEDDEDDDEDGEELDADAAGRLFEDEEEPSGHEETDDQEEFANGSIRAPAVQAPSTGTKKRAGPFATEDTDESEQDLPPKRRRNAASPEKPAPTSTPATGRGGLFDRISYDQNGNPERESQESDRNEATPKASTSNIFGFPPPSGNPSTGTSLFNFGKVSPAGDHTWKPESPIKFSSSTNAGNVSGPKPLFNFQPASPSQGSAEDKENAAATNDAGSAKPFSALFGKSASPSGTATPLQSTTNTAPTYAGFNFGLAPPLPSGSTSLFTNSGVTSRATTPGASSAQGTDAEADEEETARDEQGDLMGLGVMREANDVEFECDKAAAYKLVTGSGWTKMGVGPVFVLRDKTEAVRSVRMVADGVGRILLSSRVAKGNDYKVAKEKQVTFVAPGTGPISMRFKTADEAERFVKVCNSEA